MFNKMIKCPVCTREIARSAKMCPHCGRATPKHGAVVHGVRQLSGGLSKLSGGLFKLGCAFILLAAFVGCGLLALVSCGTIAAAVDALPPRATHKVGRIVDGDTIHVAGHFGNAETTEIIRLMGINAPERGAHYAKESTTWLTNLLKGEEVTLEYEGETPTRDRYGRIIAYVYRAPDGLDVCAESLRQGYAKAYTGKHPRREEFAKTEAAAHSAQRGLWSLGD